MLISVSRHKRPLSSSPYHVPVDEQNDADQGGNTEEGNSTANTSKNNGNATQISRASSRRGLPRNNSLSSNSNGDDGGRERRPDNLSRLPSQCEKISSLDLEQAGSKLKLSPKNIETTPSEEDVGNSTLLGRISRQFVDTFSNITLFGNYQRATQTGTMTPPSASTSQ